MVSIIKRKESIAHFEILLKYFKTCMYIGTHGCLEQTTVLPVC
jgi:hypothetical protein